MIGKDMSQYYSQHSSHIPTSTSWTDSFFLYSISYITSANIRPMGILTDSIITQIAILPALVNIYNKNYSTELINQYLS